MRRKVGIVVPATALVPQWQANIEQNVAGAKVTIVQGQKVDFSGDFVIFMLHTLALGKFDEKAFEAFGVIVFGKGSIRVLFDGLTDELHKAAAKTLYKAILLVSRVKILLGVTATVSRSDGMEKLFPHFFGPVIYRGSPVTRGCQYVDVLPVMFHVGTQIQKYRETPDGGMVRKNEYAM